MAVTNDTLTPRPEHRFTFGLWTVGNPGRDPFGGPTREPIDPVDSVKRLGRARRVGHQPARRRPDPVGHARGRARPHRRPLEGRARRGRAWASAWRTTNLFGHPAFKDGAFTSNDRGGPPRRDRQGDARRSTSAPSWAPRCTCSGAAARAPRSASPRTRATRSSATARRSTCSSTTPRARATASASRIEPKPNEPRGDIFLPTVGHALHFITTLDRPDLVGAEPRGRARDDGRAVVPPRASGRRCGRASSSTSTSTRSASGATTRTSASAPRT